jgi:uncharacterized membrane protein YhaH (DUF805 family)
MSFGQAIASFFTNYANFKGRARRSEYWYAWLFVALVGLGTATLFPGDGHGNASAQSDLWSLATFIPGLAIGARRLHDTGRSGKNLWWLALPIVGWIILLVYVLEDSKPDANEYGETIK